MIRTIQSMLTWGISLTLLISAVALLIVATPLFGNKALIVRSGSMAPSISVGDLVIVRSQAEVYDVGQVISYRLPDHQNMVVTHRITDASSGAYRTKGDANNEEDSYTIQPEQVLGRQLFVVPYIGKLLAFAKTKVGFVSLVVIPALAVMIGEAFVIVRELRRKKHQPATMPQPTPSLALVAPPAAANVEYRPPYREAEPWPNELAHLFNTTTHPMRPVMDSLSRRLVIFLAALAMVSTSTWALYSDTATSTNNVFTAAEDFGVSLGDVVINEVMWTGAAADGNDEWLELRNMTSDPVELSGWEIINAGSGEGTPIALSGTISANSLWLLSRFATTASSVSDSIVADQVNSGLSFNNSGEQLTLRDVSDVVVDQTPADDWPAGSLTGGNRRSMSRNNPPGDGTIDSNWHTCTADGCNDTTYWDAEANNYGTPKATNL